MNKTLAKILLIISIAAWFGLYLASPITRQYAIQSLSASDASYSFYDDFIPLEHKSTLVYSVLAIFVFFLFFGIQPNINEKAGITQGVIIVAGILLLAWWSSAIFVVSALVLYFYPWRDERLSRTQSYCYMAVLFLFALILRMEKLPNVWNQPLQPDALQYVQLSQSMTWFYDTLYREPFLAWINKMLTMAFPLPQTVETTGYQPIRVVTIISSALVPVLTFVVGRMFFTHRVAALAAFSLVIDKALIYRSVQGLRLEVLTIFILLALGYVLGRFPYPSCRIRQSIVAGIVCGFLLLIRSACLPFVAILLLAGWWLNTISWKQAATALVICIVIAGPYYVYSKVKYGDAMYSGNIHVNKFYYMTVQNSDAPDTSDVPFVKPYELMFKIFPWYKTLALTVEGVLDTMLGRFALRILFFPLSISLIFCSIIGYILWLQDRTKIALLASLLLLLGPMALILAMLSHSTITFDWRTIAHLTPFMAYAGADGLFYLLKQSNLFANLTPER